MSLHDMDIENSTRTLVNRDVPPAKTLQTVAERVNKYYRLLTREIRG
jgi:hypothetical protein